MRISIFCLCAVLFAFCSCSPEHEDYTKDWTGNWKTSDETVFPQAKYTHRGTIVKQSGERNMIIISGTLLGLNSSYKIPVKLTSTSRGTLDYTSGFTINGTAVRNTKDTVSLMMKISQDNKTVNDTITLVKDK